MIRHNEQGFLAQSKPLTLHSRCCHLEGLARTNFVCEQRISTVQHMSNGISLMFTEGNIRVHTAETDMRAIILTRSGGVKKFIVLGGKSFSSVRISPNPISERILDCLLFLLCQGSFFFIENTLLLAIRILNRIIDTNIFQIQCFLQNPICVGSLCTVGDIRRHIVVVGRTLTVDAPLCG